MELQNSKQLRTQLEHAHRLSERNVDKLKNRLLEKVTRERRRAQRDEQVYERIRQAYTLSKHNLPTRAGSGNVLQLTHSQIPSQDQHMLGEFKQFFSEVHKELFL